MYVLNLLIMSLMRATIGVLPNIEMFALLANTKIEG